MADIKPRAKPTARRPKQYPCTECGGDASIAYSANGESNWGGRVKEGERLCTRCFKKRGGTAFY
jgi:hypothetical protein